MWRSVVWLGARRGVMTSSFHKIYGLAVHMKTQGCRFQIYPFWDPVSKIAVSRSQNAGSVWTKRQYDIVIWWFLESACIFSCSEWVGNLKKTEWIPEHFEQRFHYIQIKVHMLSWWHPELTIYLIQKKKDFKISVWNVWHKMPCSHVRVIKSGFKVKWHVAKYGDPYEEFVLCI